MNSTTPDTMNVKEFRRFVKRQPGWLRVLEAVVLIGGAWCTWDALWSSRLPLDIGLFWFLLGLTIGIGFEQAKCADQVTAALKDHSR